MNDERIVSQVIHAGKVSGDFLLKTLWLLEIQTRFMLVIQVGINF